MTNSSTNSNELFFISSVIRAYLHHKPFFYLYIRPQEALLFHRHQHLVKPPILDFGADDGFFAQRIFPHLSIGLDLPSSQLQSVSAAKTYPHRVIYSGRHLPFKTASFQTIISNCVFEHLTNLPLNLSELYRVLKPGGYLLTTVMTDIWDHQLMGRRFFGSLYARWLGRRQRHYQLLSSTSWLTALKTAGFKPQSTHGYLHPHLAHSLEITHFLALPQLVNFPPFEFWPSFYGRLLTRRTLPTLPQTILTDLQPQTASPAALFLVCQK